MGKIEWAMWANEQAIASAAITFLGGIIGIAGMFKNWQFSIYAVAAGFLIFVFEYPRGKRLSGHTIERKFQRPIAKVVSCCGPLGRNYYVRFVLYLVMCVPCCFILPTVLGGVCLIITSAIYFAAAIKGEQWVPVGLGTTEKLQAKRLQSLRPPQRPPPRGPIQQETNQQGNMEANRF
ncbi:hypothetical protein ScPMuIL_000683 [Solemya velum]